MEGETAFLLTKRARNAPPRSLTRFGSRVDLSRPGATAGSRGQAAPASPRAGRSGYSGVPIIPLFGHEALRKRFLDAIARDALPASLLLHGPRGAGKQRLALWLAQALLCTGTAPPCGRCQSCRYAVELGHPDLHWFFPRERLKKDGASIDDVRADYAEALQERLKAEGLHPPSSGSEGLFVGAVRALVQSASMHPALGDRKVFVVGDAERMVPQEGADMAANAFLKLLEEPLPDTFLILTTSEPGALLPTVRSRVVSVRVAPMPDAEVRTMLGDERVSRALDAGGGPGGVEERVRLARGLPGALIGAPERTGAEGQARKLLDVATGGAAARGEQLRFAFSQGASRARGAFMDTLDSLTRLLRDRVHQAVQRNDEDGARRASVAVEVVEQAKTHAGGNVSPNLLTARLVRDLSALLR